MSGLDQLPELHRLVLAGDLQTLRPALSSGVDPAARDERGHTLLHLAAGMGHHDIVRFLCIKGFNANELNPQGQTALHFTAIYNLPEIAQVLIENGADKSLRDAEGYTAQDRAAGYGYEELAAALAP